MPTVAASSHRPYVSRRKRHRSSAISSALGRKALLGVLGLLVATLVISLGVIVFTLGKGEDANAASYTAETPAQPVETVATTTAAPAE